MNVLIVDDESFVRRSLSDMLGNANANFTIIGSAENGLEAVRILKEHVVDLVRSEERRVGKECPV